MLDSAVDDRVYRLSAVLRDPGHDVYLTRLEVTKVHRIAREKVRQHCEVTVRREVIRKQLTICDNAKHVAYNQDGSVQNLVILWVGEICFDYMVKAD